MVKQLFNKDVITKLLNYSTNQFLCFPRLVDFTASSILKNLDRLPTGFYSFRKTPLTESL